MELVKSNSPLLQCAAREFDFKEHGIEYAEKLVEQMASIMVANSGLGIAAPQVGLLYRMFLVADPNSGMIDAFFNPKIVNESDEQVLYEEGCISFPGLWVKVKRPASIRLRFTNQYGETNTKQFEDLAARVILHEMDHLDGITFKRRANYAHLQQALDKQKIMNRKRKKQGK